MDQVDLLRAAVALVFVLGLIGIATWLARRLRVPGFASTGPGRRLQIIDTLAIDPRHKVVLVRAGQAEHLLLLGPGSPLALEHDRTVSPAEPEPRP